MDVFSVKLSPVFEFFFRTVPEETSQESHRGYEGRKLQVKHQLARRCAKPQLRRSRLIIRI